MATVAAPNVRGASVAPVFNASRQISARVLTMTRTRQADLPVHSDESAHWLRVAQGVADALAPDAARRDREGGVAAEEAQALRGSGLLAFLNPAAYGGAGGGYADSQQITRIIARSDSNAAQILSYHYLLSHNAFLRALPDQRERLLAQSVAGGWLWGGASNPRDPTPVLVADGGGFRLNGARNFASNAVIADRIVTIVELDGAGAVLAVPGDRAGITHGDDWDAFGQRRAVSGSIRFDDVRIERDDLLGPLPAEPLPNPLLTLSVPLHQLYFVNLYLGNAEGALAQARAYILERARPWQTSGVARAADDPYVLEHYGYLDADLQAAAALADAAAVAWERAWAQGQALTSEQRNEAAALIYAAKVNSTRTALHVTGHIFELLGARSSAARYGFDRFWRNVRTHTLHDPVAYKAREVGNHALNGIITPDPLYN